jgi:hypothetical protein
MNDAHQGIRRMTNTSRNIQGINVWSLKGWFSLLDDSCQFLFCNCQRALQAGNFHYNCSLSAIFVVFMIPRTFQVSWLVLGRRWKFYDCHSSFINIFSCLRAKIKMCLQKTHLI